MIAFRVHSCDTERSGGVLSKILTRFRKGTKDDLLISLVFLRESLPAEADIDFDDITIFCGNEKRLRFFYDSQKLQMFKTDSDL